MMEFLPKLLNMSITGGIIILAVLPVRLLLKRAPKAFSYALWAVVLFRLLCPASIPSPVSLLNLFRTPAAESGRMAYIPENIVYLREPAVELPVPGISQLVSDSLPRPGVGDSVNPLQVQAAVLFWVWAAGAAVLLLYSLVKFLRLQRKLVGAVPLWGNIYLADHIASPFVMGLFRPRIYLPSSLSKEEQEYILLHEQTHIRRGDHIVRILAFAALCVHWFNPLVWAAFILSGTDMEMSCDEAVMKRMGGDLRGEYSQSLLSLATGRRIIAGTPLAFGEGDTRGRIKNVLRYRKPAFWLVTAGIAVCAAAAVCLVTNPIAKAADRPVFGASYRVTEHTSLIYETGYTGEVKDYGDIAPQYLREITISEDGVLTLKYDGAAPRTAMLEKAELTYDNFDRFFDYPDAVFGMRRHSDEAYLCVQSRGEREALIYYVIGTPEDEVFLVCGAWDPKGLSDPAFDEIRILWETPLERLDAPPEGEKRMDCLAKVVEAGTGTMTVEPVEGCRERDSGDRFTVSFGELPASPEPKAGDLVRIVYNGAILETDPCRFGKVYDVEVLNDELRALQEKFPAYFRCSTFKGLEVYVWQFAAEHYAFGLMSGTDREKTLDEMMALKGATAEEMKEILAYYGVEDSRIYVIPYGHPLSSFMLTMEEVNSRKYINKVRAMLELSPLPEESAVDSADWPAGAATVPAETTAAEPERFSGTP